MHPTQHVLAGFGIERLYEVALETSSFESAPLKGLDEETPMVAKGRELYQKAAGESALRKPNRSGRIANAVFSYRCVHGIR
jgi:hypothetical protein